MMFPSILQKSITYILYILFVLNNSNVTKSSGDIFVDTLHNSQFLKGLTSTLFETWEQPSHSVSFKGILDESSRCLVIVTNFIGSDLIQLNEPVIIRKPIPAIFTENGNHLTGWIEENRVTYVNTSHALNSPCFLSSEVRETKFSRQYRNFPGYCALLDEIKLSSGSKAWNCLIRLDMFPPVDIYSMKSEIFMSDLSPRPSTDWLDYPHIWYANISGEYIHEHNILPSHVPSIHAFLVPKEMDIASKPQIFIPWMLPNALDKPRNTRHLLISLSPDRTKQISIIFKIESLDIYQGYDDRNTALINSPGHPVSSLVNANFLENWWHWEISAFVGRYFAAIETHFRMCNNLLNSHSISEVAEAYQKPDEIIGHILVHVWSTLLKNCTYTYASLLPDYSSSERCYNSQRFYSYIPPRSEIGYVEEVVGSGTYFPLNFLNSSHSYKFVACTRGVQSMAFQQLISVYETPIWISIILALISLSVAWILLKISKGEAINITLRDAIFTKIFSLLKVLLEQGDPFPSDTFLVDGRKSVKLLLGIYLSMGIVLSNGYKNANVYEMITPRKPLRYEKFSDLLEDNITVYAFSGGIQERILYYGWEVSDWLSENLHMEYFSDRCELTYILRYPETKIGNFKVPISLCGFSTRGFMKDEVTLNELVLNNTKRALNVISEWQKWYKSRNPTWANMTNEKFYADIQSLEQTDYQNLEKQMIFKSLGSCNTSALIVKSQEAHRYAKMLTHDSENTGKETYFRHFIMFQIRGFVTPQFLLRLARMKESGVMEYWENITGYISDIKFQRSIPENETLPGYERPVQASLKGNVVVIFCLLGGGLITGILVFAFEKLFRYGKRTMSGELVKDELLVCNSNAKGQYIDVIEVKPND